MRFRSDMLDGKMIWGNAWGSDGEDVAEVVGISRDL